MVPWAIAYKDFYSAVTVCEDSFSPCSQWESHIILCQPPARPFVFWDPLPFQKSLLIWRRERSWIQSLCKLWSSEAEMQYARRQQTRLNCGFELLAAAFWWHPLPAQTFLHLKCHCLFFCRDTQYASYMSPLLFGAELKGCEKSGWWQKGVRCPIRFGLGFVKGSQPKGY